MFKFLIRLWNSPTLTTWASLVVISTNTIVVLPMVLVKFSNIETKIYLILVTIGQLRNIFDFGLKENMSRLFSYANAGVSNLNELPSRNQNNNSNTDLLSALFARAKVYYKGVFGIGLLLISVLTYFSLKKPIDNEASFWYASIAMVIGSSFYLYSNLYLSFLIGMNKVALVKKWEVLLKGLSSASLILVMFVDPTLLNFMLVMNAWVIINFLNYYLLSRRLNVKVSQKSTIRNNEIDKVVFDLAWKSFLSGMAGTGTQQGMNILIANIVPIDLANSYLLTEKVLGQLKEVSRAPFYSKIPQFAKLRGKGQISTMVKKVRYSMMFSYIVIISGIIGLSLFGNVLLELIGSKVQLVSRDIFYLMSIFVFIERFTAMHTQLYTFMNNAIIGYFRLIVIGLVTIFLTYLFFPYLSIKAVPLASSIAYLSIFTPYVIGKNYKNMEQSFYSFEKKLFIPILLLFTVFIFSYEFFVSHS
ncbi:MAG: lipopolysaccharide biosynthesis protein [Allomuricauda sp.]